jgi:hypothetical protein
VSARVTVAVPNGSLYTASVHVAAPYEYARAVAAIRHVARSLIPIRPR